MSKNNKIIPKKIGRLYFFLGNFLINLPVAIINYYFIIFGFNTSPILWIIFTIIALLWIFLIIKRLNDIGASRWWCLLILAPLVNLIFIISLFFIPGKDKKNDSV